MMPTLTAWGALLCGALFVTQAQADLATPAELAPRGPETVYFPSADERTELVGYVFRPASGQDSPSPAVVMLHGRGGPYSGDSNKSCTLVARDVSSPCHQGTLSRRHQMWGEYWSRHGYTAVLVDSFGPRGKAHGFGRHTHGSPEREPMNERTVRPLDAEGALAWLASQPWVKADRIMLHGWSNGGSTTLNTLSRQARRQDASQPRFRAALAFYPACGPRATLAPTLEADIPLMLLLASDDEEVSPTICKTLAARSSPQPEVRWYEGATHGFDDPGKTRQSRTGNRAALADALERAAAFFNRMP